MSDPEDYCRQLEAYLCRKNDGHLIRIAGPAFEQVSRWAAEGIPLAVAREGIDRYFERYYRRGPRRRPVRIEFCEADVLDAFDAWRRAVGVASDEAGAARRRPSLALHLDRVIGRLTVMRASAQPSRALDEALERAVRTLDAMRPEAAARGAARDALLAELVAQDRQLVEAAMEALAPPQRASLMQEAADQLAAYRDRMAPDAFARAVSAAADRLVRERFGLPVLSGE